MLKNYDNISIVGKTNAGKSTFFNVLTMQKNHAIVDSTPGTTSDPFITRMEIHDLGTFKIYDTAGIDESSELGLKRKGKTYDCIKESDLMVLLISSEQKGYSFEKDAVEFAKSKDKRILFIFNEISSMSDSDLINAVNYIGYDGPYLKVNLHSEDARQKISRFLKSNYINRLFKTNIIPNIPEYSKVLLNIPMDEETPQGRLLRPQAVILEKLLRGFHDVLCYRMNLDNGRNKNGLSMKEWEKEKFLTAINGFLKNGGEDTLLITDSQAIDVVGPWLPPKFPVTTFSIAMINYLSEGNLQKFVDGLCVIPNIEKGDKILVIEACNHDRKAEDIGTVQIPKWFEKKLGFKPEFEFMFGRPYQPDMDKYKLVIHCGGCMIDQQKLQARIKELDELNVPYTNYGILLSYFQSQEILKRVLKPWGINLD